LVYFLNQHTQPAPTDEALLFQLADHIHRHINVNCKGNSHETTGTGIDLRVDSDHFAVKIEKGTTRVAGIDGHVGLNKGHIIFTGQAPALGTNDTRGDRIVETKG